MMPLHDHLLGDAASFGQRSRSFAVDFRGKVFLDLGQLLVENASDEFRRVFDLLAIVSGNLNSVAHALRNHQAVDAIGGQIFHVAIEKACALSIEHSIAITNHGTDRRARSGERNLANAFRDRPQIGVRIRELRTFRNLVGTRKLPDRNFVLIGMAGSCSIHQAISFVLLVLLEHLQRASV